MPDETTVVTLDADADPFDRVVGETFDLPAVLGKTTAAIMKEAGVLAQALLGGSLDKIQAKVKAVTGGLVQSIRTLADKVSDVSGKVFDKTADLLGEMDDGVFDSQVLSALGTTVGTAIGGPAGAVAGRLIGSQLGDFIDLHSLMADVQQAAEGVSVAFGGVGTLLDNTSQDWRDFWRDTKASLKAFNLGDALSGDLESGLAKVGDLAGGILTNLWDKVQLLVGRVANAADELWDKIKEPFAQLADHAEQVLVKLGLLTEATGQWDESIRSVGSIATETFREIGFRLGLLEGVMMKLAGFVTEKVVSPLVTLMSKVLGFVEGALELAARLPGAVGEMAGEAAGQLKAYIDALKEQQRDMLDAAALAKKVDPWVNAKQRGDAFADAMDGFKRKAKEADAAIAELRRRQAEWLREAVGGIFDRAKAEAQGWWDTLKLLGTPDALRVTAGNAMTEGSREAANAIAQVRAGQGESPADQMKRLAKAAEEHKARTEETNRLIQKLIDQFEDIKEA